MRLSELQNRVGDALVDAFSRGARSRYELELLACVELAVLGLMVDEVGIDIIHSISGTTISIQARVHKVPKHPECNVLQFRGSYV